MRCRNTSQQIGLLLVILAVASWLASGAQAQTTTGSSSTSGGTTGGTSGGTGTAFTQSGVIVDAEGVLRTKTYTDRGGQLTLERIAAAKATLDPKVTAFSKLRKISLNRLEQTIIEHQGVLTDEMRCLAGLQRIHYVFYYPDSKDIVLAGPAEGWITNLSGRVVGINTGRPVVQLQDLVVGLRSYPPKGKSVQMIGCSIDPTPEGLAAMQQFLNSVGSTLRPGITTAYIINGLRTSLGMHNIRVDGISPQTHFAQVMVEADYRMKLIGIGLERPPVRLVSYVDRASAGDISRNALQRWFFTPDYECVRVSDDHQAMELVGDGVKLVGENEMVSEGGQRQVTGGFNKASQAFVTGFTKLYPELAQRSPIYAELRNVIDIAIAAAYIQQQDYYGKAGWNMEFFGDEKTFPVETYEMPRTVESTVNAVVKGNRLLTPIGGGVEIQPAKALQADKLLADEKGKVAKLREEIKINLAKGQWWWD